MLDVLVVPSLNEAVGISAIEAQAEGVSVVATNVGGLPEIIKDGVTGMLVPPADPKALADAVCLLIKDKALMGRMAGESRAWVRGRFDAKNMVMKTSMLYTELFNRNKY